MGQVVRSTATDAAVAIVFLSPHQRQKNAANTETKMQNMCKPASCLHHLLPPTRNTSAISRLSFSTPLPRPTSRTRTKKFESFVNFALNKYQSLPNSVIVASLFLLRTIVAVIVVILHSLLYSYF